MLPNITFVDGLKRIAKSFLHLWMLHFFTFGLFLQLQKNGIWRSTKAIGGLLLCKALTSMMTDPFAKAECPDLTNRW